MTSEGGTALTVATFNVHHCRGTDGRVDPDRTAREIRRIDPDLIVLQELDRGMERTGTVDQPRVISDKTDLDVLFFPVLRIRSGSYGLGIAARGRLEARLERLPREGEEEERAALVARWNELSVVAPHLSTLRGPRRLQMRALVGLVRGLEPPVMVLGDLNAAPLALWRLRFAGLRAACSRRTHGRRRIDHILVAPPLQLTDCRTGSAGPSDHLPLVSTVIDSANARR